MPLIPGHFGKARRVPAGLSVKLLLSSTEAPAVPGYCACATPLASIPSCRVGQTCLHSRPSPRRSPQAGGRADVDDVPSLARGKVASGLSGHHHGAGYVRSKDRLKACAIEINGILEYAEAGLNACAEYRRFSTLLRNTPVPTQEKRPIVESCRPVGMPGGGRSREVCPPLAVL